jgi:protein transport protein SEC61 subunit gamma and related proteins
MVLKSIKSFLESSKRILSISEKPTSKEFWVMAKIVGIGMIVIGVIGYLIKLIIYLLSGNL